MYELTIGIVILLALGCAVVAAALFLIACGLFATYTGEPIEFNFKIRIRGFSNPFS